MSPAAAALLGIVVATGLLLVSSGARAARRPRLADRLRRTARAPGQVEIGPVAVLLTVLRPIGGAANPAGLVDRLRRAGRPADPQRHRLEQVAWAGAGVAVGFMLGLLVLARDSGGSPLLVVLVTALFGVAAVVLHDRRLTAAARRRGRRMGEQLPTVADMLAFAVAAGEPPLAAVERVGRSVTGDLAEEMDAVVADVRGGEGFVPALRALADRSPSPAVGRFVDGITIASERGTPIADVLRAQAADARAAGRRTLMESAGRREIAMLIPVVFLILPIVVVIALFPGIHGFTIAVP